MVFQSCFCVLFTWSSLLQISPCYFKSHTLAFYFITKHSRQLIYLTKIIVILSSNPLKLVTLRESGQRNKKWKSQSNINSGKRSMRKIFGKKRERKGRQSENKEDDRRNGWKIRGKESSPPWRCWLTRLSCTTTETVTTSRHRTNCACDQGVERWGHIHLHQI